MISLFLAAAALAQPAPAQNHPAPKPTPKPTLFASGKVETVNGITFSPDGNTVFNAFMRRDPRSPESFGGVRMEICTQTFDGARWSLPRIAEFSGKHNDYEPFLSADGKRLFFMSSRPRPGTDKDWIPQDVWVVERDASGVPNQREKWGGWGTPRFIPEASSDGYDGYPCETADGTLFFASDREGGKGSVDLWCVPKAETGYGEPINLSDINGPEIETDPVLPPDGSFIIFQSVPKDAPFSACELAVSFRITKDGIADNKARWTKPVLITRINTADGEISPALTPDGKSLLYLSGPKLMQADLAWALDGLKPLP
ncbi:MAG: PD40 domain-containing protein [Phycisphaerales bacterium]|nr:PD40 domain-containing protein [Phycisphaerales bacterium]